MYEQEDTHAHMFIHPYLAQLLEECLEHDLEVYRLVWQVWDRQAQHLGHTASCVELHVGALMLDDAFVDELCVCVCVCVCGWVACVWGGTERVPTKKRKLSHTHIYPHTPTELREHTHTHTPVHSYRIEGAHTHTHTQRRLTLAARS
jgi:hypothetical protein